MYGNIWIEGRKKNLVGSFCVALVALVLVKAPPLTTFKHIEHSELMLLFVFPDGLSLND